MALSDDIKQIKTDTDSLRSFGRLVGGIFLALGCIYGFRHHAWLNLWFFIGTALLVFGFVAPRFLKHIFIAWMTLGLLIGLVMAPVMFTLLYLVTFVPIGLISRLCGKKFLNFDFSRETKSYWITKPAKEDYQKSTESQF